jgi:hypothetical protein
MNDYLEEINRLRAKLAEAQQERDVMERERGLLAESLPALRRILNHADPDCSICGGTTQAHGLGHKPACLTRRIDAALTPPKEASE